MRRDNRKTSGRKFFTRRYNIAIVNCPMCEKKYHGLLTGITAQMMEHMKWVHGDEHQHPMTFGRPRNNLRANRPPGF